MILLAWLRGFRPRFLDILPAYTRRDLVSDSLTGITVGFVALPLALAFAIASGVSPQAGLYTAIIGCIIVALFGGSKTQIAGPTGAFVVIVAAIVAKHGVPGLLVVTMMAGVILLALGLTGLGTAVKYIPRPVVIGFTNGIALLIASTQIKDFFRLQMPVNPTEFFARMHALIVQAHTADVAAICVGVLAVATFLLVPRIFPKVPGAIVAVGVATIVVSALHLPVATIASRFGGIPAGLPPLDVPAFRPELILQLLPSALTVAVLAAVESLLSAVVADELTGDHHNSNAEIVAQGLANLVVPLFGGIPVTGAIARTATNIRYGARSPVAGIVHSLTLLAIVVFFARFAGYQGRLVRHVLPYGSCGPHRGRRSRYIASGATVHLSRVANDHVFGHYAGIHRGGRAHVLQDKPIPQYVTILRIHGPFLFGTSDKLRLENADLSCYAGIVILRLRNMTAIDATGLHALEVLSERLERSGRTLLLCGARAQPAQLLKRAQFVASVESVALGHNYRPVDSLRQPLNCSHRFLA